MERGRDRSTVSCNYKNPIRIMSTTMIMRTPPPQIIIAQALLIQLIFSESLLGAKHVLGTQHRSRQGPCPRGVYSPVWKWAELTNS